LGAGTQVLTLAAGELIAGPPSELRRALLMGAAWAINLLVAEWAIRRRMTRVRLPARTLTAAAPPAPGAAKLTLQEGAIRALRGPRSSRDCVRSTMREATLCLTYTTFNQ
jgi:hypothetical protein